MDHTERSEAAAAAEGRTTMGETRGRLRPASFDHPVDGGASYAFVMTILADRLDEAARARAGMEAVVPGPSVRAHIGRAIVRLGTAVGGRAVVPAARDGLVAAGRPPARTGPTAGGC